MLGPRLSGALSWSGGAYTLRCVPWVKVPPEHHPLFLAALPRDPRVETMKLFGGVAAKVNGNIFAGLFGRSTMVSLSEADRREALALDGASLFDPMGDGRMRSDKVMLPERVMNDSAELRAWIARAFRTAASLPPKGRATSGETARVVKRAAKKPPTVSARTKRVSKKSAVTKKRAAAKR